MSLPVTRWGRGPRHAVLLHGFAADGRTWSHLAPRLASRWTADCVDLPGHGRAEAPTTLEALLAAVRALLRPDSLLVGYSQGGRVALAAALGHPVAGLVLESANAGLTRGRDARLAADAALAARLRAGGIEAFVDAWERTPVLEGLHRLPEHARAQLRARRLEQRPEGLARALEVYGQAAMPVLWGRLSELGAPVLLLTGSRDRRYSATAARLARRLPNAAHQRIAGVGHTPHLEAPDAWSVAVSAFSDRLP